MTTSPERWARVRAAVEGTLATPAAERDAYLDATCGGDAGLREEIARLVAACESAGESETFVGEPAAAFAAPVLAEVDGALRPGVMGDYVIEREIGAGGMATVYLALDRKHQRHVAIKVLRPELAAALGVERFLAEIRVTANLQHPNLLPLFDSGEVNGLLYYVMPFVEGESLRARLDRERELPVEESVRLAVAIASALDYAHRQGVIHRDLKPENILLSEAEPLVADFGIALAITKAGGQRVTQTGLSLGTPRYMSPEQAAADRDIDARSDIYSLACVVYEMLVGDPPHVGSNVQAVIARVLTEEPRHVRATRPTVPVHLDAAIHRALAKTPADRFASAREFADALSNRDTTVMASTIPAQRSVRSWLRDPVHAVLAVVAIAGFGSAAWLLTHNRSAPTPETARFVISSLSDSPREGAPTITPNGQDIVYVGAAATKHAILVRHIDEVDARPLAGTEGAINAFVSPDGRRIGFFTAEDKLKIVPLAGGSPVTIASVFRYTYARWGRDSAIIVDSYGSSGLGRLADSGGTVTPLTRVESSSGESRHAAPLLSPDGRSILFTVVRQRGGPGTLVGDLAIAPYDGHSTQVATHHLIGISGREAVALVDDWLLYVANDGASIEAVRFDLAKGHAASAPVSVLQDTAGAIEGVTLANNGTLLYTRRKGHNTPMLVDVNGTERPLLGSTSGSFMHPRLSPDGRRLVIQAASLQGNDVWVYDLETNTPTRLTVTGSAQLPTWTPDGQRIVFFSQEGGGAFWWMRADGSTPAEKLLSMPSGLAGTVTNDAHSLVFERLLGGTWSVWAAALDGDRTPRKLVEDKHDSYMPAVSPDGKWLAYASNLSGRYEVYVMPFSRNAAPVQVSDAGGVEPAWSSDGRRLFYRGDRQFASVSLSFAPRLAIAARQVLFRDAFEGDMPHANYDVTKDGKRFVTVAPGSAAEPETVVILDWLPELRAKLRGPR